MASTNEKLADLFTRRDILVERLKAGEARAAERSVQRILLKLEALTIESDFVGPRNRPFRLFRLRNLIESAESLVRAEFAALSKEHNAARRAFAHLEWQAGIDAINKAAKFTLATKNLTAAQESALLQEAIVEGAPARTWWRKQGQDMAATFRNQMTIGMRNGETIAQLARRVHERPLGELSRAHARGLVRTSFQSVQNSARQAVFQENSSVIKGVQQRSTLDNRTSDICKAYSGLVWSLPDYEPIGHSLPWNGGPPRHINCRSSTTPVLKSYEELGEGRLPGGKGQPSQSVDSRFRENLKRQGFSEEQIARARLRQQASMDGQVAADLNYEQWLGMKGEPFQRKTLGPVKYNLWKKGELPFRDLVDQQGRALRVQDLVAAG